MNKPLSEMQMEEAIKRMKLLELCDDILQRFKEGEVTICELLPDENCQKYDEEIRRAMRQFEESQNCLVYVIVRVNTPDVVMDSMLYVSSYPEEWELDRSDLKHGFPLTYTVNHSDTALSEFGSIVLRKSGNGSLIRIG